jgi:stearoyl-CoA desaturase (delta-9 desaturase)
MNVAFPARPFTRSRPQRLLTGILIAVIHALPIWYLVNGPARTDWLLFAAIFPFQGLGVVIGLHRYFAHHCFSTSRGFQFFLALCCVSAFGDPIGFAGKHRIHHLHTDRKDDPHTPRRGFWSCWFGSLLDSRYTDDQVLAQVPGLAAYPELMWLHRHWQWPGLVLCLAVFLIGGLSGVAIGVLFGVAMLINHSSAVNYFCHKFGRRRFDTDDDSTNHFAIALLTLGEGWHNNHHRYPVSARAGFCWWEFDLYYWIICGWEAIGLIWDVRRPPEELRQAKLLPTS